ncbi:unnamed protein product [Eruca vesicaria subsp. sativa]|uniref:Exocyst complex component SEC5 n=1 Tax=Eruca vesicaria subsp. sativa TaxID=29727 RepID=A0ABC8M5R2_ERUVS|nr:unnamed protein product [Eruca vesicaria subsp. sativa]
MIIDGSSRKRRSLSSTPADPSGGGDGSGIAKLYVAPVPMKATEYDVRQVFEKYGNVTEITFPKDKMSGERAYAASSNENNEVQVDPQSLEFPSEEIDALKGRYIKRLTAVLVHHIPLFWKTAISVFSGKFVKRSLSDDASSPPLPLSSLTSEVAISCMLYRENQLELMDSYGILQRSCKGVERPEIKNEARGETEKNKRQQHFHHDLKNMISSLTHMGADKAGPSQYEKEKQEDGIKAIF